MALTLLLLLLLLLESTIGTDQRQAALRFVDGTWAAFGPHARRAASGQTRLPLPHMPGRALAVLCRLGIPVGNAGL